MKRIAVVLTILLLLGMAFSGGSARADDQTITITVTIQSLALTLGGGGNWDLGIITLGATPTTWTASTPVDGGQFTLANDGNVNQDLTISVADSANWAVGDPANQDEFAVGYGVTATLGVEPAYTNITTGGVALTTALAPTTSFSFDLQLKVPTVTTSYAQQSIVATVSGSPSP